MTVSILVGDCRDVLKGMEAQSVNCVVTSPPYFGLRDYGTAKWEGGNPDCQHTGDERWYTERTAGGSSGDAFAEAGPDNAERLKKARWREKGRCTKCGATHVDLQLGLEQTPDEYIAAMIGVFRECRRVLRDDGTLWLNIGDSYSGSGRGIGDTKTNNKGQPASRDMHDAMVDAGAIGRSWVKPPPGLKNKDLIGIPWMLAFALRADGWYLRQDIIWHKPNPMPESVTDRCTKAHEYVFLLSKSPRYLFDAEAISEEAARPEGAGNVTHKGQTAYEAGDARLRTKAGLTEIGARDRRNKRDVWTITTQPFAEAHFATMAPELARTCIMAGCPLGGTVLDPFGGAGTTGLVADQLQRNAVLIELNPEYAAIARKRIDADAGLFSTEAA